MPLPLWRALLVLALFGWLCQGMAQEVTLNPDDRQNKQTVVVKLYDNDAGGYLLDLPLTFHYNRDNILFMIVGNDTDLGMNNSVWMFDKATDLNNFLKQNRNVTVTKPFKKQIIRLARFFEQSENIEKYALFDQGFESVQSAPKPVFFRMTDPNKPAQLRLKFYVAIDKNDGTRMFTSEAGAIKITVNLQKNNTL